MASDARVSDPRWFRVFRDRVQSVFHNDDSDFDWKAAGEIKGKGKAVTREQLVDFYERIYSELAESYAGTKDAFEDEGRQRSAAERDRDRFSQDFKVCVEERDRLAIELSTTSMRLYSLLDLVAKVEGSKPDA